MPAVRPLPGQARLPGREPGPHPRLGQAASAPRPPQLHQHLQEDSNPASSWKFLENRGHVMETLSTQVRGRNVKLARADSSNCSCSTVQGGISPSQPSSSEESASESSSSGESSSSSSSSSPSSRLSSSSEPTECSQWKLLHDQ